MTTTTTQTKLIATEGVLRPRAYVTKGYRSHAAEPNYWPQVDEPEQPKSGLLPLPLLTRALLAVGVELAAVSTKIRTVEDMRAYLEAHTGWRNHPITQRLRRITLETWVTWALILAGYFI